MARANEKRLGILTVLCLLGFAGSYVYQNSEELFGSTFTEDSQTLVEQIQQMQDIRDDSVEIRKRFMEMEAELNQLEGSDSQQTLRFREIVTRILNEIGLTYGQITDREHNKRNEDFKIISLKIDQMICTPQQFGELLYRMERESSVMEVEECSIQNQLRELGDISPRFRDQVGMATGNGVLVVDLVLSRLVEYSPAEKAEMRSNNRRRRS